MSRTALLPNNGQSIASGLLRNVEARYAAALAVLEANDLRKMLSRYGMAYVMLIPAIVLTFVFCYIPIYGILIIFTDYDPLLGVWGSRWIGFEHFEALFADPYFLQLIRNTLAFSLYGFVAGFFLPIAFALLMNEVRNRFFSRCFQTISFMPYFVSTVVICGALKTFLAYDGGLNAMLSHLGVASVSYLSDARYFRLICILTVIWQTTGWNSIIYLAALSGIDQNLIEAARIDGCNRRQLMWHVTIPGILPTVVIMLILSMGSFVSAPTELILLLYSPLTYETGDVLGTYVYRMGIRGGAYEMASAVNLISNLVSMLLLVLFNWLSRRISEYALW